MDVKGKTVLVTGGSQGLGEQLCRELAEAGMKVIVNCAHNAERARKIAEEIGGCAMVFDIADPEEVRNAFADIRELHVLINNARLDPYKRPSSMSDAEWFDRMIGVNLKGPYLCSLAEAENLLDKTEEAGRLFFVSGCRGGGYETRYCCSQQHASFTNRKGSATAATTEGENCLFYKLSYDNEGKNLGFYWAAENGAAFTNEANKAYLALTTAVAQNVRGFGLEGDGTTGIGQVENGETLVNVYTIDGIIVRKQVKESQALNGLKKGIYIVNGKKVIK